jgi:hypothetical protein
MLTDSRIAVFAAVFAAVYAAHQVADHWVQTQHQADCKGKPGWTGRVACLAHVLTYTATALLALIALAVSIGLPLHPAQTAAGLTVSAVTHYIADRRTPLRRMADWLGKDSGWLERGGGMYAMDQSWHIGWLFIAALVVAA